MARLAQFNRKRITKSPHHALLSETLRSALDFLLPLSCVVCTRLLRNEEDGLICGHCWTLVRQLPHPRCARCGHPCDNYSCRWCPLLPAYVRSARSFCWIGAGSGKAIIHALKYDGWRHVAASMAKRMARLSFPRDVVEERTAIVPVPLSRSRRRERGFNQCELIARELAQLWNIPAWGDALVRGGGAVSQTQLTPGERKGNVAGAFTVSREAVETIRGGHIILLDDVVTTGATLRACAGALFRSGARTISYTTFGRAPSSGDRLTP